MAFLKQRANGRQVTLISRGPILRLLIRVWAELPPVQMGYPGKRLLDKLLLTAEYIYMTATPLSH